MATANLTKRTIDSFKASEKDQFWWDETLKGFGVKVTPAGKRIFIIQYRMGGRGFLPKRYTIGTYGSPWTPAAAREEAERLLIRVKQGADPSADKHERLRIAINLNFSDYAARFLEQEVKPNWKNSYGFAEGILRNHVTPALKGKVLPGISKTDITALFDRIPATQKALRRNVFTVLRRLFRWAKGRGDIDTNPLEGFEAPPLPASRDRILKSSELRLAWIAAGTLGFPYGPFYQLLIGTGQRREEVAGLDWRELDRHGAEWLLPGSRAKNGVATIIHLPPLMIGVLDGIAKGDAWPKKGLVFSTNGKTAVSGYSKAKSRLDRAILAQAREEAKAAGDDPDKVEIEAWKVHDLRRTLATGMQRLNVRFEVTEAILNHVSGSKAGIAGVYQRHDWKDEKRSAWNAWDDYLRHLITPDEGSNVVPIRQGAEAI